MGTIQSIDISILKFIQENLTNPFLNKVMVVITSLGNKGIVWILIGILLISIKRLRKYGYIMFLALVFCALVGNITLKPIVARVRPFDAYSLIDTLLIAKPKDFSFPSGHTMSSFAGAVVIFYMNKKAGIAALILSTLIGFSRLYLFVHYPSDVFMGMILGMLLGILAIFTYEKIEKIKSK